MIDDAFIQPDSRPTSRTENTVLWTLILPAAVLGGLCYLAGATTVGIVVAGVAFAIASFIAPSIALYAYFALQALDVGFKAERFSSFTPAKALAPFILLLFVTRLGRRFPPLRVSRSIVWVAMLLGVYGLVTAPFAIDARTAAKNGAQIVVQVLLLVVGAKLLTDRVQIHRALWATVIGGLIASIVIVFTGGTSSRAARATLGEFANPNSVAHGLSVSLIALPAAWCYTRNTIVRLGYLAIAPMILLGLMRTGSRSAIAAAIAAFAVGGLVARRAGFGRALAVAAITTVLAGGTMLFVMRAGLLDGATQQRVEDFLTGRGGDVGEERGYIWKQALREYARRPIFGFGFGNTAATLQQSQGMFIDVHSSLVGPLVEGGPIGFTLFLLTLGLTLKVVRGIRQGNPGIAAAMIFCMLVMSCLTHTVHFTKWFWLPITMCVLLAEQTEREREIMVLYQSRELTARPSARL